jgi:hypothetical protein
LRASNSRAYLSSVIVGDACPRYFDTFATSNAFAISADT